MRNFIHTYRYKAAYLASLIIALNIANSIVGSPTYSQGFFYFFLVLVFVCIGIYFHTKDMAKK